MLARAAPPHLVPLGRSPRNPLPPPLANVRRIYVVCAAKSKKVTSVLVESHLEDELPPLLLPLQSLRRSKPPLKQALRLRMAMWMSVWQEQEQEQE